MRLIPFIALMLFCAVGYAQFPMVGSGRQVYRPDQVDSLFYWFDAQDLATITTTNNKVTAWNDKSGNGYNVLQADTSKAPTYSATAGPGGNTAALTFDGTDDFLASAAHWWGSDDLTVFVVMKNANATRNAIETIISKGDGGSNLRQWNYRSESNINADSLQLAKFKDGGGTNYNVYKHGKKSTAFRLLTVINNGVRAAFIGGVSSTLTSSTFGSGDHTILNFTQIISIGAQKEASYTNFLQGSISEIIIFSRALSATERQGIEAYLSSKYDLPLENKQKPPVIFNRRIQPDYVDSLFYWFDASDAATLQDSLGGAIANNEGVATWLDKSGRDYHVTQSTNGARPLYKSTGGPNGTACIQFDGTDDFLASTAHWWGSDDLTIFVVMKNANATRDASEAICGVYTAGGGISWLFTSGPTSFSYALRPGWGNDGSQVQTPTFSAKSTAYRSIAWAKDLLDGSDNTSPIDTYVNGSSQSVSPAAGSNITSIFNQSSTPFSIGAVNTTTTPSAFLQGSISEIIVFSRALTNDERVGVEQYLKAKWGL